MRLGLLGGTFNPVHNGHLFLALEAMHVARLDRVVFIPNRLPPHKEQPDVCGETRFSMMCAAVEGIPEFEVSRRELDRQGRSYTIDTLQSFPPEQKLTFICGADAFTADWHRLEEVVERLETLLLANRAGYPFQMPAQLLNLPASLQTRIQMMTFPDIAISSSELRARIRERRPYRFLIPEPVYRIITESRLYCKTSATAE